MNAVRFFTLAIAASIAWPLLAAEEFSFDLSSYEKKPYQLGGYLELLADRQWFNEDSAVLQLAEPTLAERNVLNHQLATLELTGQYQQQNWQANVNLHATAEDDSLTSREEDTQVYEALLAYKPDPGFTFELGKKALRWGKGYAWNPVAFAERPKNPDEPDLSREGYTMAVLDMIKSYPGDLQTLAFTPVYLPVRDDLNDDYGPARHDNLAAKLYLLYKDTDIDLVYLSEGSRSRRYGLDFSRNITSNFEIHGEWAYLSEVSRAVVDAAGNVRVEQDVAQQWLLGVRYLTENETTYIIEYYHNQAGYSEAELRDFFTAVELADATNNTVLLGKLASLSQQTYLKRNPGQDYLYLRASNKEPFDWLYVTTAVSLIANLDDHSYSLSPEVSYTGFDDLELRVKAAWLQGDEYSEFGEKRNARKLELRLRYYF